MPDQQAAIILLTADESRDWRPAPCRSGWLEIHQSREIL